jgi:hypothetical protein
MNASTKSKFSVKKQINCLYDVYVLEIKKLF